MYFVVQKKHNSTTDVWDNNVHVKETKDDALHQFHAFMSTYAYGQNPNLDYIAAEVQAEDGRSIKSEIDNRMPAVPEGE